MKTATKVIFEYAIISKAFTVIISKEALIEKTLSLLEYPRIMESVASMALSEEAASIIKESKPVFDKTAAEAKIKVRFLTELIKTGDNEPRSWLPSVGFLLPKIKTAGTVLDLDEAHALGLFIERAAEIISWVEKERIAKKEINPDAIIFPPLPEQHGPALDNCGIVRAEIFKIINKDGQMRDLPVLRAIKKRIESLEKELKSAVSRYSAQSDYKRMLQSPLPSERDGRAVIAVKANFRGRIKGIVHEVSSSGQTVFIEPLDAVEKNNELLLEKRNLDAEIQKIMRELTAGICVYAQDLNTLHAMVIELECLRARARYSCLTKGNFAATGAAAAGAAAKSAAAKSAAAKSAAEKCENETMHLKKARHPLLKKAIPINIKMSRDIFTLIITGPNTGGKTVALKTLGLLAAMNQSALALPLEEGSCLPLFDGVYADIGDEQSINQSLSTFSAHITNISAITSHATEKSLVLLDELGSGTDPEEGGAIAMAILDFLIQKKSHMIITTHHGILKNYGYTRQGVENASVEFDAKTLCPTYKIINGLPGESRALDIAEANGLDREIVKQARKYIDEDKTDISAMIKNLEQKQRELAGIEKKSAIEQNKIMEEKRKTDLKELRLRQKEAELKRESAGKLQLLLKESRKTLENLVRELKEGEISREKTIKVKNFLNELARNVDNESAALDEEERSVREELLRLEKGEKALRAEAEAKAAFAPGTDVFAGGSKQKGIIIRQDKKGAFGNSWIVKIGSVKMSFPESELTPASEEAAPPAGKKVTWAAEYSACDEAVYELKLLGMRLEDAKEALRRQIEAASRSGLKTFAVIHGKGSGILQKGIHEYLKSEKAVEDYYFSRPELGGFGRTEVVLR